jgi:hypothetical protein
LENFFLCHTGSRTNMKTTRRISLRVRIRKKIVDLNPKKKLFGGSTTLVPVLRIRDGLSRIPDPNPTIAPSRIRGVKKHRIPDLTVHTNRDEK